MGVVGRRVCIKCEFYKNVDRNWIPSKSNNWNSIDRGQLIEGRVRKRFCRWGSKAGKKKIYSEGVQSRERKIFSGDAGGEGGKS